MALQSIIDWVSADNMGLAYLFKTLSVLEKSGGVICRLLDAVVAVVVGVASGLVEVATLAHGLVLVHMALPVEGTDSGTVVINDSAA